jgi:hypothetical protein
MKEMKKPPTVSILFNMSLEGFDKWLNKPFKMVMIPPSKEFSMQVTHDSFPPMLKCLPASALLEFESDEDDEGTLVSLELYYPREECGITPFSSDEVTLVVMNRLEKMLGWEPNLEYQD